MKFDAYEQAWLPILEEQEAKLRVEELSAEDAWKLGSIMIRLAHEKYQKPIALRVVTGGQLTLSHLMEGTSMYNDWWMDKKLNTCRLTGVSSIRALVEVAEGLRAMEPEFENTNNYALCGGCFPLKNAQGRVLGYVLASGMAHQCDHQLIVDALSELLNIPVGSVAN